MKPKEYKNTEADLFRLELVNIIDMRHELVKLAEIINWEALTTEFGDFYADEGRPGADIRLMCGLQYLKHTLALSDEQVCLRWVENPYYQYFCGCIYFEHQLPIDPSSMTRFRNRIGQGGCETLLSATIDAGLQSKTIKASSLSRVVVDSTVMEKAVAYPTDARLLNRCREQLVRLAKTHGLSLRQSYSRKGRTAALMVGRYAHARQFKRMHRENRKLKTWLGRVTRDIERKLEQEPDKKLLFAAKLAQANQLLTQGKTGKNKLYSLHAPEVECIAKGKAHKKYEFGVKVGVVTTLKEQFVLSSKAFAGRPYDGHTLFRNLADAKRRCGQWATEVYVDRGYRGYHKKGGELFEITIAGQKRGMTVHRKRKLKRRNAIEAIIGHMKTDGLMGRNHLLGKVGDAMNAILCGAGQNLRMILKQLRLLFVSILGWLLLVSLKEENTAQAVKA